MHNPSSTRDEGQAKGGREWLVPLLEPIAVALESLNSPRSHMIYLAAQLCLDHLTGLAWPAVVPLTNRFRINIRHDTLVTVDQCENRAGSSLGNADSTRALEIAGKRVILR